MLLGPLNDLNCCGLSACMVLQLPLTLRTLHEGGVSDQLEQLVMQMDLWWLNPVKCGCSRIQCTPHVLTESARRRTVIS